MIGVGHGSLREPEVYGVLDFLDFGSGVHHFGSELKALKNRVFKGFFFLKFYGERLSWKSLSKHISRLPWKLCQSLVDVDLNFSIILEMVGG